MKEKIGQGVAIIALVVALFAFFRSPATPVLKPLHSGNLGAVGQIGNMLAEQYMPYVQYNQGYNTALDITSTGNNTFSSTTATTLKVGQLGTAITRIVKGTCNIQGAGTIAASTTAQVDCQAGTGGTQSPLANIPAWAVGDVTFFRFASSSATTLGGVDVLGASASTTAGYITIQVYNQTGGTFTWTVLASSSGQYLFIR